MRCEAKHPTQGTQCGLPAGHSSAHGNGTICHPWNDPVPPQLAPTVTVIKHDILPPRTMMVSSDMYESIKEKFNIK